MKLLFITILFLISLQAMATNLIVKNASVKLTPPTMNMTAAFMTISNNSDNEIKLLSVNGDFAKEFEIHEMKMENGNMKMRPMDNLTIPAHQSVELKHGGYHIMIFSLKKPLVENQEYILNLKFDHNQNLIVKAKAIP